MNSRYRLGRTCHSNLDVLGYINVEQDKAFLLFTEIDICESN